MSKSLLFAALAVISISFCFGQVPQTLSYQGLLTNNDGDPLQGDQPVNFKFYTSLSGGSPIPGSTRGPITVETFKGLFTTTIGDGSTNNAPLDFSLGDQPLFIEIILGTNANGPPLSPRVAVTAVPYAFVANSVKNVDVTGKVKENGNDLLPQGVVVMWSGTLASIPHGWALCDGQRYQINTVTGNTEVVGTGGFLTPDLRERFIVGAASEKNTALPFPVAATGGGTTHTLSAANIPNHQHEANGNGATINITASGKHQHTGQSVGLADNDDFDGIGYYIGNRGGGFSNTGGAGFILDTGSDHTHPNTNFVGLTGFGAGLGGTTTTVTHGLPPYFALAFIVKL